MAAPQSRSRFYGDESDDDDDDVSVNSVNVPVPGRQNRFQLEESDSESEDEGRVVRTEKDKKFEAINTFITAIRNQLRQNNWVETIDDFDRLVRVVEKSSVLIAKEGVPRTLIRLLVDLEDGVNGVSKADVKAMSKSNSVAFNRMKMTLKKHNVAYSEKIAAYRLSPDAVTETVNRGKSKKAAAESDSDDEIIIGRAGVVLPTQKRVVDDEDVDDDDDDDDEDDDDDDDVPATSSAPQGADKWRKVGADGSAPADEEAEDEDDDFSDESSDSSDDDEAYKGLTGRARWVKRPDAVGGKSKDEKDEEKNKRRVKQKEAKDKKDSERSAKLDGALSAAAAVVDLAALESLPTDLAAAVHSRKWTKESLIAEITRVHGLRGRRGIDVKSFVTYLTLLSEKAPDFGSTVAIPALVTAVSARFDLVKMRSATEPFLDRAMWKRSVRDLSTVFSLLEASPHLRVSSWTSEELAGSMLAATKGGDVLAPLAENVEDDDEGAEVSGALSEKAAWDAAEVISAEERNPNVVRIVGDLSVFLERLQDEHTRALLHTDPHKTDYVVRIGDESGLSALAERAFDWFTSQAAAATSRGDDQIAASFRESAVRLALLRIEHVYYKADSIVHSLRVAAATADKRAEVAAIASAASALAMEDARKAALEASRTGVAAPNAAGPSASAAAASTPAAAAAGAAGAKSASEKETAEAAMKAIAQAANAGAVGDTAAKLAIAAAHSRGKPSFAAAAGVVAKAIVIELSRKEGGLLSGGAIVLSRNSVEMDMLADVTSPRALADAEAAGVDLGELSPSACGQLAPIDTAVLLGNLAHFVYLHGDAIRGGARAKNRAMLCQIYHHALHDRFSAARDLFLMSGVQERIADMSSDARSQEDNVKLEILYNRALTMLGVAAFRSGLYTEAHECLSEICGSGHTKELLAQGISLFRTQHGQERDERAELEERRRLVPYHMHINVDLVDACHLTAAMLLEVPNIAAADFDPRRRELSRAFRKHLDAIDKKHFVGPPETTRDHIMMAALALADGELDRCVSLVCSLKLWSLWEGRGVETVLGLLKEAIKEAGLVTYLHTYSRYYDALSRDSLADMFQLSRQQVQTLASRLIFNGELMAKWDQPTSTIVMQQLNPSRLQHLAENFADQVQTLADANGRALEIKTGVESFRDDRGGMYRHRGGDWGGRGGGGAGGGGGGGSGDRDRPPGGGRGGWRGGANGGPGGRGGYSGGGDRNRGGWSRGGRGGSMRGGIGRNVGSARREYRGIGI